MKKPIKISLALIAVITVILCLAGPVLAGEPMDLTGKLTPVGSAAGFSSTQPSLAATAGRIIQTFLGLLGVIFMSYIIYAGYLWLTAHGEEEKTTKAKAIIRGGIIGVVVILAAYAIAAFVTSRLMTATNYADTEEAEEPAGLSQ